MTDSRITFTITFAEVVIRLAILEVEKLPADLRLTTAVDKLLDAQSLVSNWAEATGNVPPQNCPCCV